MIASFFMLLAWLLQATAKGSIAIALVAAAYLLIGRRVRAQWWYALWILSLLRLVVPAAPASAWSIFNLVPLHPGLQLQLRGAAAQMIVNAAAGGFDVPWWIAAWKWLALIWLCGFAVVAARTVVATLRMRSLVNQAFTGGGATPLAWRIVEAGRTQLAIKRAVSVVESPLVGVPALHGFLRPTLLLPEGMCEAFAAGELRHVILHELAHLRRHDVAVSWLLNAVRMIHWFNPLAWYAVARIEEERELACDDLTLTCLQPDERIGYGQTILKLLERFRSVAPAPALVGIVNRKEQMKRRLMMISTDTRHSRGMLPLLAALSAIGFMALTDAPQHGQSPAKLDPTAVRTLQRFDRRIDLNMKDASLGELICAVAVKSGVAVTRSPSLATSEAQHARFTIHADNVPARAVLADALAPYGIIPEPDANAMRLTSAPACLIRPHQKAKP